PPPHSVLHHLQVLCSLFFWCLALVPAEMKGKRRAEHAFRLRFVRYAASAVAASSSWSMERICSRSSGVSWWPCTVLAWSTARSRTSSSVPEMTMEQGFSAGKRRQSMTLRVSAIVPPLNRPDYKLTPKRASTFIRTLGRGFLRVLVSKNTDFVCFVAQAGTSQLFRVLIESLER